MEPSSPTTCVWNGWVYFWNGREWVPHHPWMPHYNPDVLVQSSTNNDNLVAAEDRSDEYAQRKRKRWENDIRDELIAQQFDGDVEALVPAI